MIKLVIDSQLIVLLTAAIAAIDKALYIINLLYIF
jgi:hypothetical protein